LLASFRWEQNLLGTQPRGSLLLAIAAQRCVRLLMRRGNQAIAGLFLASHKSFAMEQRNIAAAEAISKPWRSLEFRPSRDICRSADRADQKLQTTLSRTAQRKLFALWSF
jgi:hypothetical protein